MNRCTCPSNPAAVALTVALFATLLCLGACAEPESVEQAAPTAVGLPPVAGPEAPTWSPKATDDDPAVATVGAVPILRSQLQAAVDADAGRTTPRQLLERLIQTEMLAQKALEAGYYRVDVVEDVMRAALVRELLTEKFERAAPETFFDEDVLQGIYSIPSVRVKFDHVDIFKVSDAQFTCCPRRWDECDPEDFEACMKEEEPHVREVHADILRRYLDKQTFAGLSTEWGEKYPRLYLKNYSFFYDVKVPHDQQKGFNIVNENVAAAVQELEVGAVSEPIRSRNGWHILMLTEHQPEQHRGIDDPEVRGEIIQKVLPQRKTAEYMAWTQALRKVHGVEVFPDRLRPFFLNR